MQRSLSSAATSVGRCRRCQPRLHSRFVHECVLERKAHCCASAAGPGSFPEEEEEMEEVTRESSMKEYLELKQFMLKRTQRFGTLFTLYMFLVVSAEAALCTAIGAAGSYLYVAWLCRDVDNVTPYDRVPMVEANAIPQVWPRRIAKAFAGLRQQCQPRLLVPIMLAAGIYAYNTYSGDHLTLAEEGALLGGFWSYKVAHILYIYEQLRPRFGGKQKRLRPTFDEIPDMTLDIYGRSKQVAKGVEEAERLLAEEEAKRAARRA